jgi:hypothetical protein
MGLSEKAIKKHIKNIEEFKLLTDSTISKYTRIIYLVCDELDIKRYNTFKKILLNEPRKIIDALKARKTGSEYIKSLERLRKVAIAYDIRIQDYWYHLVGEEKNENPDAVAIIQKSKVKSYIENLTIKDILHRITEDEQAITSFINNNREFFNRQWHIPKTYLLNWKEFYTYITTHNLELCGRDTGCVATRNINIVHKIIRLSQQLLIHRLGVEDPYWVCRGGELNNIRWIKKEDEHKKDQITNYNYIDFDRKKFVINIYKTAAIYGRKEIDLKEDTLLVAKFLHSFVESYPFFSVRADRTRMNSRKERALMKGKNYSKPLNNILSIYKKGTLKLTPTDVRKVWMTEQKNSGDPKFFRDGVHGNSVRVKMSNYCHM